jgi:GNAT superfamily N-acetyltransferase
MSKAEFNQQVEALWAAHFGCPVDDFRREGTTLLGRDRLQGQRVIQIVYIGKRAMAEIDPGLQSEVDAALTKLGRKAVLSSELLGRAWGEGRIADTEGGLIFHLQPGRLVRLELDPQFALRRVTSADQSALDELRKQCTDYEIQDAYVEIEHEIAWGCFKGTDLVAVGSGYRRNGFMDFGVLTCPDYRGHGLARHVVRALSEDSLERGLIPQYRCNRVNQASRRVAEGVGFTLYYTTESITLGP